MSHGKINNGRYLLARENNCVPCYLDVGVKNKIIWREAHDRYIYAGSNHRGRKRSR